MLEIAVLAGCGPYAIKGCCSLCSGKISVCNTGEVESVFVGFKDKDYTECSPLFRRTVFQPNRIENLMLSVHGELKRIWEINAHSR